MLSKLVFIVFIAIFLFENAFASDGYNVIAVNDDLTLQAENGEVVELSGLYFPDNYKAQVKEYIEQLLESGEAVVAFGCKSNRYDNMLCVKLKLKDEELLPQILERGWAVSYSNDTVVKSYLKEAENKAKKGKNGVWANGISQTSEEIEKGGICLGEFCIVDGVVSEVKEIKDAVVINFGKNWKTDFSIYISKGNLRKFDKEMIGSLMGKKVSARGWIVNRNGPAMELYAQSNLDIL